jgi:hypothetical protein
MTSVGTVVGGLFLWIGQQCAGWGGMSRVKLVFVDGLRGRCCMVMEG